MARRFIAAAVLGGALLLAAPPSYADPVPAPQDCSDPANPCPVGNTFPDATDNGPSPGAMFGIFALVAIVIGGGTFLWRISTARRIAEQAGLDPDTAVTTTILSQDGLAATYLAANLRQRDPEPAPALAPLPRPLSTRSAEYRLGELKHLHDEGLITEDEYDRRRTAILDTL